MFVEYSYCPPCGTLNILIFNHCRRLNGIFKFNEVYTHEVIRFSLKSVALTMFYQGYTLMSNNIHDCKLDLKFKDGSIRTAETLVTMNLPSRS